MLFMEWMMTNAEGIYPFIILVTLLIIFASKQNELFAKSPSQFYLVFFLILFSVTHYHPQWFIWISPFFLIDLIAKKFKNIWYYLILFAIYVFIVFTFENSLSVGLFGVLNPQLASFTGTANLISKFTDIFVLKSISRSVFAAISLYLAYDLLLKNKID
jgi:hypothetical protein